MKRKIELPTSIKRELNISHDKKVRQKRDHNRSKVVDKLEDNAEKYDRYASLLGIKKGKLDKEFIQDGLADLLDYSADDSKVQWGIPSDLHMQKEPLPIKKDLIKAKKPSMEIPKYVPPQTRVRDNVDGQIKKTVKGQLNKLSDANMESILGQINDFYRQNARRDVTVVIVNLLLDMASDSSQLNDSYLLTFAGFSTALYHSVGIDFGSFLVEGALDKLNLKETPDKARGNLTSLLGYLYGLGVVSCVLVYDLIKKSLEKLDEIDVEILLRLLKICGMQMRADDPTALKDIILLMNAEISKKDPKEIRYS